MVELALGNLDDAAAAVQQTLILEPAWPDAPLDLREVLGDANQNAAVKQLDRRLAEFPNDADARLLRGVVLHFGGEREAAQAEFDHAVRVTRGTSVAREFLEIQPEARDAAALVE